MKYTAMVNGLPVEAQYSQNSVETIFLPLLKHLQQLQKEKGKRILVMLSAPPAAGKSTLAGFLSQLDVPMTVIGMDGFHRRQEYLLTHTVERDGREVRMVDIKGAPVTFDLERLTAFVKRVSAGEKMGWPIYDRMLHNPVDDAVLVDGDIVLLEGNYLLLDEDGWRDLHSLADYTISITADTETLRQRLIDRKTASNSLTYEQAAAFVDFSDLYNARLCLEKMLPADLRLHMRKNGEYILAE